MAAAKKTAKTKKKAAARTRPRRTAKTARTRAKRPVRRQPESLRLRSVAPTLTADDLLQSLAWYRDVLGFTVAETYESDGKLAGAELVAGTVHFWMSQDDWKKGKDRMKGEGFRLYCETAQDIDALAEQIKARGGRLAEEPHDEPWGARALAVVDPSGFKITIMK